MVLCLLKLPTLPFVCLEWIHVAQMAHCWQCRKVWLGASCCWYLPRPTSYPLNLLALLMLLTSSAPNNYLRSLLFGYFYLDLFLMTISFPSATEYHAATVRGKKLTLPVGKHKWPIEVHLSPQSSTKGSHISQLFVTTTRCLRKSAYKAKEGLVHSLRGWKSKEHDADFGSSQGLGAMVGCMWRKDHIQEAEKTGWTQAQAL